MGGVAPRDEVMAEVNATRNRFLIAGFVLVGVFAVVFLFAVRRLVSRPLDEAGQRRRALRVERSERARRRRHKRTRRRNRPPDALDRRHRRRSRAHRFAGAQRVDGYVEGTEKIATGSGNIASRIAHAGEQPGRNRGEHGADHVDGAAERRSRVTSEHAGHARGGRGARRRTLRSNAWCRRWATSAARRKKIAEITSVIEGIAFQTNILGA